MLAIRPRTLSRWRSDGTFPQPDRRHRGRALGAALPQVDRPRPGPLRPPLAVATGLRYGEIAGIRPGSFALDRVPATVTVEAGSTKNGQTAVLDLPRHGMDDLRPWLVGRPPGTPVFDLPDKGSVMVRRDLGAAGIAYRDSAGLVFDFHALRCQHATLLDLAGVTPRVVQKLMRHSTLELTGRYTKPRAVDLERAASSLPTLRPRPESSGAAKAAATGTDGPSINDPFAHYLPTGGDGKWRIVAEADAKAHESPSGTKGSQTLPTSGLGVERRPLSGPVGNSGDRTRTGDLRIMRPPL